MEGRDAHMEASQAEDHVPLPCSEDLCLPRRTVVLGLAWGRGFHSAPMTPGSQENLYWYWAGPSLSPVVTF